jgi:drug/metabolite transporter (DMT)-like permease
VQTNPEKTSLLTKASIGPWLIAFAALTWATDAVFRSKLVGSFGPIEIVYVSHLICLPFALWMIYTTRKSILKLDRKDFFNIIILSAGGSVTALVLFTVAFATTSNYTVPILIQKLQPLIAISLASIFLKERLTRLFWLFALLAITGTYLLSFGWNSVFAMDFQQDLKPILLALGAAVIWGSCTVAGRSLVGRHSFLLVTGSRYIIAFVILFIWALSPYGADLNIERVLPNITIFSIMALIPGLGALLIYYLGLSSTKASVATLSELAFPIGAVLINWIVLGQVLGTAQIVGAAMLITSITYLSLGRDN